MQRWMKISWWGGVLLIVLSLDLSGQMHDLSQSTQRFSRLDAALAVVRSKYSIVTGLEMGIEESEQAPIILELSGKSVAEALDSIVAQRPAYEWSLESGVYDVYPKMRSETVSRLKIASYAVSDANLAEASATVSRLPEFQSWLSDRGVIRREFQLGPAWKPKRRISLTLENVSLREILNQLLKQFGLGQWVVVRYGEKGEFIAINFYEK